MDDLMLSASIINKTISEYNDDNIRFIGKYGLYMSGYLTSIKLPRVEMIMDEAFSNGGLQTADLPMCRFIGNNAFRYTKLTTLILRSEELCILYSQFSLWDTNIKNGTGYIYVPRKLVDIYKVYTNWSTFASQFRALEDYTIDGTITGELDATKI